MKMQNERSASAHLARSNREISVHVTKVNCYFHQHFGNAKKAKLNDSKVLIRNNF